MIIVLIDHEIQCLDVLHLTKEEEAYLKEYDYLDAMKEEAVETILRRREINVTDFNPTWVVCDNELPVFDEDNQECPVYVIR